MKMLYLILTICFLSLYSTSYSQAKTGSENARNNPVSPTVTKGYYSIGNNGEKLNVPSSAGVEVNATEPVVQKGYYSTPNNSKKPAEKHIVKKAEKKSLPVIKKGYYSIDSNREKEKY